ncbi:hypothetical protein DFH11DRAFT_881305 [Phellopilus nigrolimitatus]|nr:hypothetical protein DFH11DRAFT_881305 [Phellopilus nigrolimitatus]
MHPPSPAPSRPSAQPQKPNGVSSKGKRSKSPARSSSSQWRSSTLSNTKTVNSGASLKTCLPSATARLKVNGGVFPEPSSKQRKIEFADDSDFSTDEEWDTENGSEEAERTNGEIAPSAADRRLAEASQTCGGSGRGTKAKRPFCEGRPPLLHESQTVQILACFLRYSIPTPRSSLWTTHIGIASLRRTSSRNMAVRSISPHLCNHRRAPLLCLSRSTEQNSRPVARGYFQIGACPAVLMNITCVEFIGLFC